MTRREDGAEGGSERGTDDEEMPLSGLAEYVANRPPPGELDEVFQREPFEEVDARDVWREQDEEPVVASTSLEDVTRRSEGVYEVPKREFCDRCRFFAEPPESDCNHEGTEILEFVDMEHALVESCPVVVDRLDGRE